jgi:CHAD domain-containing protein
VICDSSRPEDLHVLRKRGKELRYALEMFAPVLDDARVAKAIKDLKRLQDVLGRFQDSEVQRTTLRGFAQEMVADGAPAEALLAMGELMSHLFVEQQRASAEFATAFASYVRPANHWRMLRLLGSGGKTAG